jgi:hypothetical protein
MPKREVIEVIPRNVGEGALAVKGKRNGVMERWSDGL